ncbi:hypothetical protein CASFOL_009231 [Castilleja foliolosa]|uniref:GRF-type domain-containing protein n=1 Tax=Castilleja foliolosa TaxID=1961234 RepID=A0ABD3DYM4_9LAMI
MSRQSTRSNQFPAQNGSGSRSSSSYGNAAVRCHCRIQLELVTSWTDDNHGRHFQACPNYKMSSCCGFFRWFDEEMCSRSKEVIPGLLRKTNKLELLLATEQEKNKHVQDYELLLADEQEKNKFVQVVLERQANVLEKHSAVMEKHSVVMEKHSAVIEDQRNLTAELQMFKKKERMLKIIIVVMVLIIAFQVMSQPEFGKTMPRKLV